jgi:uncharacterized DUF497 family protein
MFEWDDGNIDHIAEHGLEPEDVEDALLDPRRLGTPAYNRGGEIRRAVLGATSAGRILFVVVTTRDAMLRVVTARDATRDEQRRYRRRGK